MAQLPSPGPRYLVELKFTQKQAGATDVDTVLRKVSSKADNTMGIIVSMSGYSATAVSEASGPKTPLLLLDHRHIYLALGGTVSFTEIVERVRRHASQTGDSFLAPQDFGRLGRAALRERISGLVQLVHAAIPFERSPRHYQTPDMSDCGKPTVPESIWSAVECDGLFGLGFYFCDVGGISRILTLRKETGKPWSCSRR